VLCAGAEARAFTPAVAPPTFVDGLQVTRALDAIRTSASAGGALVAVEHGTAAL
jgi:hypothetical protein